ncbi:hypothetical protein [Streptomyces jumonjinensis]|uniref:hypothetical protein n=1 Tax=Streptomyces jumonjinensis TaxID=1945 RepID=UPI0037A0905F
MRDVIALLTRALIQVLSVFPGTRRTTPGRHSAAHFASRPTPAPAPEPAALSPWRKPWAGPSAQQVWAIFRAEEALHLSPVQRERFFATAFAECGIDYPYRYPGDHFSILEARA